MKIREYKPDDYKEIAELFHETIHSVCTKDYSAKELEAWAPKPIDYKKWKKRLNSKKPYIILEKDVIIGFAELEKDGHIDCFYIHKDYQRQGVGSLLFKHLEKQSHKKGLERLYAEVSITAQPFFKKHGFKTIKKNIIHTNGQTLTNFSMEKEIM